MRGCLLAHPAAARAVWVGAKGARARRARDRVLHLAAAYPSPRTFIFRLSAEHCVSFLDPLIESWSVDLATFALDIVLNRRVVSGHVKRFEFVEKKAVNGCGEEPGMHEFLDDPVLRGNATDEEIAFLRRLTFNGKRPTALYYYRELQNLRDTLHFHHEG